MVEEIETRSTLQIRGGGAPSFMKQEGEGKGRKHLGLNIVIRVAQLMKARKFEMYAPTTCHSNFTLWTLNKSCTVRGLGTPAGLAAEGRGTGFLSI